MDSLFRVCPPPAVLRPPVITDHIGRSVQPTSIVGQRLNLDSRKILDPIWRWMTEGAQQLSADKHGDVVRAEPKLASGLLGVQSSGKCRRCGLFGYSFTA